MELKYIQVDAFSCRPLFGNPAAVVFAADDVPATTMQKIARELNLSETVFLLEPTTPAADYRVRIFTPQSELPFAGHPTVAAAHAVLARYAHLAEASLLRQECGIGIVPVEVLPIDGQRKLLRMTQRTPSYTDTSLSRAAVAAMLGCEMNAVLGETYPVVSTGVSWLIIELASVEALAGLNVDLNLISRECKACRAVGMTVFAERSDRGPARIRVRTFAPGEGVAEDPVCGSGNGSVAAFIARDKHAHEAVGSYLAEQGIEIGRDGIVHASWERTAEALRVQIGGEAVTVATGQLLI